MRQQKEIHRTHVKVIFLKRFQQKEEPNEIVFYQISWPYYPHSKLLAFSGFCRK